MSMGASWPPRRLQNGGQLGRLLAAKTPSKMEANLGSQKSIFEAQVGLHLGGGSWRPLGAIGYFFGAFVGPPSQTPGAGSKIDFVINSLLKSIFSWFSGSRKGIQHEFRKDSLWRPRAAKTPPKWRPTWTSKNFWEAKLEAILAP